MGKPRKTYTEEFRRDFVRRFQKSGMPVTEFVKIEGVSYNSALSWIKKYSSCWVGIGRKPKASDAENVIETLKKSFEINGMPLVLSTDNGPAYSNKLVSSFLRKLKIVHLQSLPRTPQHNGAVEVGIKELKEIMRSSDVHLKEAIKIANARPRKYGRKWSTSISAFEKTDVPYNKMERDNFYNSCAERHCKLKNDFLNYRERRLKERSLIFEELMKRGFVTQWKMTKYG